VDDEVLDQLEEALIGADVGVDTTLAIIEQIQARVKKEKYVSTTELNNLLQKEIANLLVDAPEDQMGFQPPATKKPYVILVVGVNGVGKTTTIGKLAHHYKEAGNEVILGAADTFRAAAVDQLTIWSERVGVQIVKQNMGSDPSAVAFDTIQSAIAKKADVVLIDTAGRLHNKAHLMDELNKIKRVIQKQLPDAPHEVLLVLDGSTGQNALEQAKQFMAVTNVNALAITKLDGTAKGGVVLAIAHQCKIPVKYIGMGEQINDLLLFNKTAFVDSLFSLAK
jgi:fused signal recognition particle receptor